VDKSLCRRANAPTLINNRWNTCYLQRLTNGNDTRWNVGFERPSGIARQKRGLPLLTLSGRTDKQAGLSDLSADDLRRKRPIAALTSPCIGANAQDRSSLVFSEPHRRVSAGHRLRTLSLVSTPDLDLACDARDKAQSGAKNRSKIRRLEPSTAGQGYTLMVEAISQSRPTQKTHWALSEKVKLHSPRKQSGEQAQPAPHRDFQDHQRAH
jgi:hypothetical protein